MYFLDFVAVLVRRWYILIIGIILTGLAGVGVHAAIGPTFQAHAAVVILPPTSDSGTTSTAASRNPYLSIPLGNTADVLARIMATDGVRQELKAAHATSPFTIVLVADGSPVLEIAATDSSPAAATNTASVLVKVAGTELEKLQVMQNVPKNAMIRASQLISPTEPDVLHGSQIQALLGVVVLGLILSVTVCFAAEGAFTGRGAALAAAVRGRRATGSRGRAGSKGATRSPGDSRRSAMSARADGIADQAEDDSEDADSEDLDWDDEGDDEEQSPAQPRDTRGTTMVLVGRRRRSEE
ncbi:MULTISPECIES: hypothetical protein [unclassified Frankia]|uniref:hypothetical protein n=1 Tax=unclassified Frankia TaxID=2632575 RepID=UPI002AD20676|nr:MULTISPECIES: hypothetical protein [unclassified Frankia]